MTAGRRPRPLTAAGREALEEVRAATDLVLDARQAMRGHADRRRRAVLRATECGVPYRRIAEEIGVSVGTVQQLVNGARAAEDGAL